MLLSEIITLNESFDINNDKLPNTFGDLLKHDTRFMKAFGDAAIELGIDGKTFNELKKLKPWHPETHFREKNDSISMTDLAMEFVSEPQHANKVLVYFQTQYDNTEEEVLEFSNEVMDNKGPIYLRHTVFDDDHQENDKLVELKKSGASFECVNMNGGIVAQLEKMKPNLQTFYGIQAARGPLDGFSQFRTWILFR